MKDKDDKNPSGNKALSKTQPQGPGRSKSLMRPSPQSPKEKLLYDGYKHVGPSEVEHKLTQI